MADLLAQGGNTDAVQKLTQAVERLRDGLIGALPGIGVAIVVLVAFWLVGMLVRWRLRERWRRTRSESYARVFATLAYVGVVAVGVVVAIPFAFPSVNALSILGGLGLIGVAAGFAFQDILSNLLSGILLLIREPFRAGDQITVGDVHGTVRLITIRETEIRTFDGRLVYVPNQDVYTNAIEVQTAEETLRTSLVVGVDYDTDLARARQVALRALAGIDGIADDPAPEAYYTDFGASSINLDLRYWTSSRQADVRRVQDQVVERIKAAFDEDGINIPFDIVTLDTRPTFDEAIGSMTATVAAGNGHRQRHPHPRPSDGLEELSDEELYERARRAGIEGRSAMSRWDLIDAIREA